MQYVASGQLLVAAKVRREAATRAVAATLGAALIPRPASERSAGQRQVRVDMACGVLDGGARGRRPFTLVEVNSWSTASCTRLWRGAASWLGLLSARALQWDRALTGWLAAKSSLCPRSSHGGVALPLPLPRPCSWRPRGRRTDAWCTCEGLAALPLVLTRRARLPSLRLRFPASARQEWAGRRRPVRCARPRRVRSGRGAGGRLARAASARQKRAERRRMTGARSLGTSGAGGAPAAGWRAQPLRVRSGRSAGGQLARAASPRQEGAGHWQHQGACGLGAIVSGRSADRNDWPAGGQTCAVRVGAAEQCCS